MDRRVALLATIDSALKLQPSGAPLSPESVTELGQQLGLSAKDTFEFIRQLSADSEVDLEWGGRVRSIHHKPAGKSVTLGPNATYVGPGARITNSAIGAAASIQTTGKQAELIEIVAKLTAVLNGLRICVAEVTSEQQASCQQLIDLTKAMQGQLLRDEKPEKDSLSEKLDRANKVLDVLEKTGKLGAAIGPRLPLALDMLRHAYQTLSGYLGNF